jgi:hypothetical protein
MLSPACQLGSTTLSGRPSNQRHRNLEARRFAPAGQFEHGPPVHAGGPFSFSFSDLLPLWTGGAGPHLNWTRQRPLDTQQVEARGRLSWRPLSFQNLVLKGYAFGVVFREPRFRGVSGGEDLQMVLVADPFVRIDVDPDGAHRLGPTILFTLRLFGI